MLSAIVWGGLAAASLLIGYFLARRGLSSRTLGIIMGIGAGAIISAISYELIPASVLVAPGVGAFSGLGAIAFFAGDWLVDRREDRRARTSPATSQPARAPPCSLARCLMLCLNPSSWA